MRRLILLTAATAVALLLFVMPAEAWDARFRIQEPPPPIPTAYTAHVVVDGVPMTLAVPLVPLPVQPEAGVITADAIDLPAGRSLIFRVQATDGGGSGALSNAIEVECPEPPCATTTTTTTSTTLPADCGGILVDLDAVLTATGSVNNSVAQSTPAMQYRQRFVLPTAVSVCRVSVKAAGSGAGRGTTTASWFTDVGGLVGSSASITSFPVDLANPNPPVGIAVRPSPFFNTDNYQYTDFRFEPPVELAAGTYWLVFDGTQITAGQYFIGRAGPGSNAWRQGTSTGADMIVRVFGQSASVSTTTSTTTTTQPPSLRCDINGDGMIGASDALAILQAAVGVRPNLCEVNGD